MGARLARIVSTERPSPSRVKQPPFLGTSDPWSLGVRGETDSGRLAFHDVTDLAILGRVALAALVGFTVGWEREFRGKPAGERTFALVALGAAALTAIAVERFPLSAGRVIQGVVTGVGFLGAGLIFQREHGAVKNLTTAASAWAVAAIGVLIGAGEYSVGLGSALLVLFLLEVNFIPIIRRLDAGRQRGPEAGGRASQD